VLRAHPDLTSIYVSTVNSLPVLRAAEQEGRLPGLIVVTTDLFPELVERIRSGANAATVYQRPLTQGRMAFQALYQFLLDGTCPSARIHVVPHLVMRSNLDLVLERLPVDLEGAPSAVTPDRPLPRRLDVAAQTNRGPLPRPRRVRGRITG
jgi:LacI family transcriptional regulator